MANFRQLHIQGTRSTPEVRYEADRQVLSIRGQSYPENAFSFYEPLLQWVDDHLAQLPADASLVLELQLPYINTTSTKCFLMLLEKLEASFLRGNSVSVLWLYDEDNESELECAEEFKEDLDLPFHIVAKPVE